LKFCENPSDFDQQRELRRGVFLGLSAYLFWGFFPVYFKAVAHVAPLEVLAHRVFWSMLLLLVLLFWTGQWPVARKVWSDRRTLLMLSCSTTLIAVNWFVFIYAVGKGEVLQSSLGYFINPLVSALLGTLFLGERLRPWQRGSLVLAVCGVLYLTLHVGAFPWISLLLAFSFGTYGLLRKKAHVESLVGLTVETILLGPLAFGYLLYLQVRGEAAFLAGIPWDNFLLPLAGLVTATPLLWFNMATKRLRLTTIGFLQYITPTLHFLLAVLAYGESFTTTHLISFALIWAGLAIYSVDAVRATREGRRGVKLDPAPS